MSTIRKSKIEYNIVCRFVSVSAQTSTGNKMNIQSGIFILSAFFAVAMDYFGDFASSGLFTQQVR